MTLPETLPVMENPWGPLESDVGAPFSRDWIKVTVAFGHEGTLDFMRKHGFATGADADAAEIGRLVANTVREHRGEDLE